MQLALEPAVAEARARALPSGRLPNCRPARDGGRYSGYYCLAWLAVIVIIIVAERARARRDFLSAWSSVAWWLAHLSFVRARFHCQGNAAARCSRRQSLRPASKACADKQALTLRNFARAHLSPAGAAFGRLGVRALGGGRSRASEGAAAGSSSCRDELAELTARERRAPAHRLIIRRRRSSPESAAELDCRLAAIDCGRLQPAACSL